MIITLAPDEYCTGCGACQSVCPKKCIIMNDNGIGQSFPVIDKEKCVNCHICEKTCPVLNVPVGEEPRKAYAAWSLDEQQRQTSASGGVAYELYRFALSNGYKVVGASQNEDFSVSLKLASTEEEIIPFKNSKYVFSECYELYPNILNELHHGQKVMIVGVSCQIAAMRKLYEKYKDQLIFIEILCHGMVPFSYLRQHVDMIEKEKKEIAISMSFRAPEAHTYTYTFALYDKDCICFYAARDSDGDSYQYGFSSAVTYLESCYHCHFARQERMGDIILCDFYGLGKDIPFRHDTKDVSCILTVTERGGLFMNEVFKTNVLFVEERPVKEAVLGNPRLRMPNPKSKDRIVFEKRIHEKNGDFEKAIEPLLLAYMRTLNRSKLYYHWQGLKYRMRKFFIK